MARLRGGLPRIRSEAAQSLAVHPTQLYESFGSVLIALLAYLVVLPRKRYEGQVFLFFVVSYGVLRALLEILRADERGGLLGLSTSQLISAILVLLCAPAARYLRNRQGSAALGQ